MKHDDTLEHLHRQAHRLLERGDSAHVRGLGSLVDAARAELERLGHYTEAELEQAALALRRELQGRVEAYGSQWEELRRWAEFDLEQIEQRLLERLLAIADPTRVDLARLTAADDAED